MYVGYIVSRANDLMYLCRKGTLAWPCYAGRLTAVLACNSTPTDNFFKFTDCGETHQLNQAVFRIEIPPSCDQCIQACIALKLKSGELT